MDASIVKGATKQRNLALAIFAETWVYWNQTVQWCVSYVEEGARLLVQGADSWTIYGRP